MDGGINEDTARKIFDEWEEFARYGFNKAHAADYGVLAVQTAYLKAHYPVEYMTAVLSVNQNDTSKVALYAADSRLRMSAGRRSMLTWGQDQQKVLSRISMISPTASTCARSAKEPWNA